MTKIRMFCNQGMSASILVQRVNEAAVRRHIEADILAFPVAEREGRIDGVDCVLIGPPGEFAIKGAQSMCAQYHVPADIIPVYGYGLGNENSVLDFGMEGAIWIMSRLLCKLL